MSAVHDQLSKFLRTPAAVLESLEQKMANLTGKNRVLEKILEENETLVWRTLDELGLARHQCDAASVYDILVERLCHMDQDLYEFLDRPELAKLSKACGKLCETALSLWRGAANESPSTHSTSTQAFGSEAQARRGGEQGRTTDSGQSKTTGFFIKKEKAVAMLEKFPPGNLLSYFGYATVSDLVEKEGFSSVFSALRFAQDQKWMHQFFEQSYADLSVADFEVREVEIKVLEERWLKVADRFLEKKYHNLSHLKELGIIFIIPLPIDTPGETIRLFTLLLHYLNEVPFYSKLFSRFSREPNFPSRLQSLLRGDVPEGPASSSGTTWRIVQRYLSKDDSQDFRLFEPHVNPEAEHWYKATGDFAKISTALGRRGHLAGFWHGLDAVGGFFKTQEGEEKLVSFDLIDLVMSLVKKGEIKYLYHQQEALWNKIFIEYFGREKMEELIGENIIGGFIKL